MLAPARLLWGALLAVSAGLPDRGVFSSLDARVETVPPAWVSAKDARLAIDGTRGILTLVLGGEPVKAYPITRGCSDATLACLGLREPDRRELARFFPDGATPPQVLLSPPFHDTDGDGIADAVDILLGAKKTVLLKSAYKETARKLKYPGGDVPPDVGVCTDVIVRALRNAGIDLQKEIFEDAGRARSAYPSIPTRNPNLDHRRVRNLAVYFQRHWRHVADIEDLLPGDVVLLDTFPSKPGPDHIGIVSDRPGDSGRPLIINAWTNGCVTDEMDLLRFVPMTMAYRVPAPRGTAQARDEKPDPMPGLSLPETTRQIVLVETDDWTSTEGRLSLWQRGPQQAWKRRGRETRVTVGGAGLGWGRGLHALDKVTTLGGPVKREGDGRAPAGIFRLLQATGYGPSPPRGTSLPYRRAGHNLRCVDDPRSPQYNQLVSLPPGTAPAWDSDERMRRSDDQYRLTVIVEHNRDPAVPQAGSCIFLHVWPVPGIPSPGCTMMPLAEMRRLLPWLRPAAHPVLVQLPHAILKKAAPAWGLPR
jgi:uncharacterized protein YijF (DUF1287 family)